ncbi:MAG: hypothetical protein HOC71_06280 [Candidatus Latescibacteria bacterium]|jgi:hypothetical protein|nr:hypothetical protein [Candidatus Latescibacterota bacterium]
MRYFTVLIILLLLTILLGCMNRAILSPDEAAQLGAKLANEKYLKLFKNATNTLFSPRDYPAVLLNSRWKWGKHNPAGVNGYSTEVQFNKDGSEPEVEILFHTDINAFPEKFK